MLRRRSCWRSGGQREDDGGVGGGVVVGCRAAGEGGEDVGRGEEERGADAVVGVEGNRGGCHDGRSE